MPYPRRLGSDGAPVGTFVAEEAGRALRRARLARDLTLRQVGERSNGAFTPTAVAGYERAERSISLERFCELCRFYDVAPAQLLSEILGEARIRPHLIVDLTQLQEPTVVSPTDD